MITNMTGYLLVYPYNQDVITAELTIITVCIIIITGYCLGKIILKW